MQRLSGLQKSPKINKVKRSPISTRKQICKTPGVRLEFVLSPPCESRTESPAICSPSYPGRLWGPLMKRYSSGLFILSFQTCIMPKRATRDGESSRVGARKWRAEFDEFALRVWPHRKHWSIWQVRTVIWAIHIQKPSWKYSIVQGEWRPRTTMLTSLKNKSRFIIGNPQGFAMSSGAALPMMHWTTVSWLRETAKWEMPYPTGTLYFVKSAHR